MSYCTINSWMEMSVIKDWNFWSKRGERGCGCLGNISGDCSECCCHLSAAHTATDPKARGIFLQHRQGKRFERLGRMVGREGHEEGQKLKMVAEEETLM